MSQNQSSDRDVGLAGRAVAAGGAGEAAGHHSADGMEQLEQVRMQRRAKT